MVDQIFPSLASPSLAHRFAVATGADPALDAALAEAFAVPPAAFTASVDACRRLVAQARPGWRLHVGYGASGLFPYATLTDGRTRTSAEAPTVPLAILRALLAT